MIGLKQKIDMMFDAPRERSIIFSTNHSGLRSYLPMSVFINGDFSLMSMISTESPDKKFELRRVIYWVFFIKFIIFLIDPNVMFFLGDSCSYINTALYGWIPSDRSFLYGLIIGGLTIISGSLTSLVFFQVICSGMVAVSVGYILNEFFSVNKRIALLFSILCALDPLQLMYERYVMTEAISLFILMWYFIFSFHYLRSPKYVLFLPISISGVLLVALRVSFLPIVLSGALLLPFFSFLNQIKFLYRKMVNKMLGHNIALQVREVALVASHFLISCSLILGSLESYKMINGELTGFPPALQYNDGFFLAASWAPILKKQDIPDRRYADLILDNLPCDLRDFRLREDQRWNEQCLIGRIKEVVGNELDANNLAHKMSLNALNRDPLGVIMLAVKTYLDFWDYSYVKEILIWDRGGPPFPEEFMTILQDEFDLSAKKLSNKNTFTSKFYFKSIIWYYTLLLFPIIVISCIFKFRKETCVVYLIHLSISYLLILIISVSVVQRPVVRYLHSLGFIGLIFCGFLINHFLQNKKIIHVENGENNSKK